MYDRVCVKCVGDRLILCVFVWYLEGEEIFRQYFGRGIEYSVRVFAVRGLRLFCWCDCPFFEDANYIFYLFLIVFIVSALMRLSL